MCGIAGMLVHRGGDPVSEPELVALRDAQRHRGPDDAGCWIDARGRVGLAHRRLSIVDLSPLGRQPMATADGRLRIVYNGEIYNYADLRRQLEAAGHAFVSHSDTEAILHGYREWGRDVLDRLRGMFAFALHDEERRETLLARDPLGIKPLYYAADGRRLVFASEVQAIRTCVADGGPDPEALAAFLSWGSIAPPRTLYRGIRALPPGSWMRVAEGRVEAPVTYYRAEEQLGRAEDLEAEEAAALVRDALLDSARHHLVADVPVGSFLSGGVDSSALLGLLAEVHGGPIRTVNLSFDDPGLDESRLAGEAAGLYGSEHHDVPIRSDEIRDRMGDAMRALDQPSIDGVNIFFVSEAAVKTGLKVAVSGVGGDELFGGYESFERVPRIRGVHARLAGLPGLGGLVPGAARLLGALPRSRRLSKLSRALAFGGDEAGAYFTERGLFSPAEVRRLLAPEVAAAIGPWDPVAELAARVPPGALPEDERVSALEIRQYLQVQLLRDADAMSMRHSLEVRTPLVDRELLRIAARVPPALRRAGPAKRLLRDAPRPPVPAALWQRRKQGFTLPFEHWLRHREIPAALPLHSCLRPEAVQQVERDFRRGRLHWSRLWALVVLGAFLD